MSNVNTTLRKTFGHSTRILLPLVFVALAILGSWVAKSAIQVRRRDAMLTEIELAEGSVVFASEKTRSRSLAERLPRMWRMCGAKPIGWLLLPEEGFSEADRGRIRQLFPEARVAPLARRSASMEESLR
jgi:hypothetical protein